MQGASNWLPPLEKTTLKKPSLIRVNVFFNQTFSICRMTSTILVLKFDIDFITLWDDPMEDSTLRIINTSELFEQSALIDADKNSADSDDCGKWDRFIFRNSILLGQMLVRTNFCK